MASAIILLLENHETPDVICGAIDICKGTCHLFPEPSIGISAAVGRAKALIAKKLPLGLRGDLPAICDLPGVKKICDIIYGFANDHLPLDDADQDGFS